MKKLIILLMLSIFLTVILYSQTDKTKILQETRVSKLTKFAEQKMQESLARKKAAEAYAKENDIPIRIDKDGVLMELQYVSEDGVLHYYQTTNEDAATTISTDHVYPGASAGLSLTGNGFEPREWDGGGVRQSHQEYGGRTTNGDGVSGTHYHSTHVAGTIMAAGVQSAAKGMAYEADLKFFEWTSDTAEMTTEASSGAIISNHSYSYSRGWVWNPNTYSWDWYGNSTDAEDPYFGFYDSISEDIDQIVYDAPYYLPCWAASNDRGDGPGSPDNGHPEDGPYDCLPQQAVSKNLLTVAAVLDLTTPYTDSSDVDMTTFSSWGPCDDGRIKPDISANGQDLYSTYDGNDSDYDTISGTSMATPSVTGSIVLLQEHYEDENGIGNYMKASTAKALVIHTADEAGGSEGPDYRFGWGLMNTDRAAQYISDNGTSNSIDALTLSNGATFTDTVTSDGINPLKVTICWTDVPGTPVSVSVDPTDKMLVNDLDLRVTRGGTTYYPWKLDGSNPGNAATNAGDNDIDNVEQVLIDSPTAGDYVITVNHKGTLVDDGGSTSSQDYAMVVSGIAGGDPICSITSPSDGASIKQGNTETITVSATDPAKSINSVRFYINGSLESTDNSSPYEFDWDTGGESLGSHGIKVVAEDDLANTDTDSITVNVFLPEELPYFDNCDSAGDWDMDSGSGNWLNVDPTTPADDHTDNGNCFLTNGNSTYSTTSTYILTSPQIDLSGHTSTQLSFWMYMEAEASYDGGFIECYDGSSWNKITNTDLSLNYDGSLSTSYSNPYGGEDVWYSDRTSWTQVTVDVSAYTNDDFRIRFKFGSDSSNQNNGWGIDDVKITSSGNGCDNNNDDPTQPIAVEVQSLDIDGNTVNPDASIDPDGSHSYQVYVNVSDATQEHSVPSEGNVLISYDIDVVGNVSSVTLDFDLAYTGLGYSGSNPNYIQWWNSSISDWENVPSPQWDTPSSEHVSFSLTLQNTKDGGTEIIMGDDDPLPVTLNSFTSQYLNGLPVLNWTTATESENAGWNVYRSISNNFGQAHRINQSDIEGHGSTTEQHDYTYIDEEEVEANKKYFYWIESIDYTGNSNLYGSIELVIPEDHNQPTPPEIPTEFGLYKNYPNPFNPSTEIGFALKKDCRASLIVYNIKGKKVRTLLENHPVEKNRIIRVKWDGRDQNNKPVSSGVYFYKLKAGDYSSIKKMIMMK